METNLEWQNLKTLVGTPRQHKDIKGRLRMNYILGASIVETCLQMMIDLWEMRKEKVYEKEEITKQQKRKKKAATSVQVCTS